MYWGMYHTFDGEEIWRRYAEYPVRWGMNNMLPAWSLHRLLEMNLNSTDTRFEVRFNQLDVKDAYEFLIAHIEWLIKEGYFQKEYLV